MNIGTANCRAVLIINFNYIFITYFLIIFTYDFIDAET